MNINNRQNQLYRSQNHQELLEQYSTWASSYDRELVDDCRYIAPQKVVEILSRWVTQDGRILDAGAGTGLVGEILHRKGYKNLEGIDISAEMLAQAKAKNVYTALSQQVMGQPLNFPSHYFDAVVSVGVFTYGHAPSYALDELIRISKPQGHIIFTMRLDFYENSDFKQKLIELETSGKWRLIEISDRFPPLYTAKPEGYYQIWVYQV